MGKFILPSDPSRAVPPPQPTLEDAEADDARVNDLKNQFIDAKQQLLYTAPQAFLRQQGSDAITGAEGAGQFLDTLRQQTLDQTANNDQRTRLGEMLDWHVADAKQQIHRHVAEQSDAWQQNVAVHTVELATRQAALESGDAEKVGFVALAAYDAEKARALKGGLPAEAAHESGRSAWSGAYKAAIETQAGIDPQQAVKLFDQAKATLDPQTREALQPRIDSFSRDAQADVLADEATAPDADRVAILDNPAVRPEVRLLAEIKITTRETIVAAARQSQIDTLDNRLASGTPQALAKATYVPGTYAAIADGYAAAGDPARAAAARRLAVNEPLLASFATAAPVDQMRMLSTLEPGPVRDQALRIKDASDRMLANDALRWGTTTQRANGVGELVPLDLTPSPTNTPQAIAGALGRREQQARQIEALSGAPTLAMTKEEVATLKTNLDSAPVAGKQTTLRSLATDLGSDAIAHLAPALAGYGPLADGYALALSIYAAKTSGQNTLADRILDGLDRMKAAGDGGQPVADTGPDWRRAFDKRIVSVLPYLGEKDTTALRTATAALYTQSMALKGKDGATLDGDEFDNAILAVTGEPPTPALIRTGAPATDSQPLTLSDGVNIAQQPEPPATSTVGRGVAPNVEPLPDSEEFQTAITKGVGHIVHLPDGSTIPDEDSPTGYVMGPVDNLSEVAAAGRNVGADYARVLNNPHAAPLAILTLGSGLGILLGQGGKFDYQREGNILTGYIQLRHFRKIANVNVGLAGQQAGLTLHEVLRISGGYAGWWSGNADPTKHYGLATKTREFIEIGYNIGKSGMFDPPAALSSMAGPLAPQTSLPSRR